MRSNRFLFAPSATPGNGTGHLRRAIRWAAQLPPNTFKIYVRPSHWRPEFEQIAAAYGVPQSAFLLEVEEICPVDWDFVILDRRSSTKEDFRWWSRTGISLIGLDEGGPQRRLFPYLWDTFPIPTRFGPANLYDPSYLSLPDTRRSEPADPLGQNRGIGQVQTNRKSQHFRSVLISYGGEDPAGLTERCTRWLIESEAFLPDALTVVLGPLFGPRTLPEGVKLLQAPPDLSEQLYRYDLVCTSFGLTAYEAGYAGCGVILLNPSRYHLQLSRLAGFPSVGIRRINSRRFAHLLNHPEEVRAAARWAVPAEKRSPAELLARLKPPEVRDCPACGRLTAKPVLRCNERSFFRCLECGLLYQMDFFAPQQRYTKGYFFEEYRSQYGRSYLEDFETIQAMGRRRIEVIQKLLTRLLPESTARFDSPGGFRLLDVGCAYGPFLSAAAEAGFRPEGLEPVSSAVEYIRARLDFPVWNLSFEEFSPEFTESGELYDVVSMWFVIEHFPRVDKVLSKAGSLLTMGGLLAFSTPNCSGISGRTSLKEFLRRSPRDHHTIWSPTIARRVLPQFGFRVKKFVITGHHPERFPFIGPRLEQRRKRRPTILNKALWSLLLGVSTLFGLGDTFEVYAEKTGTAPGTEPGPDVPPGAGKGARG